MNNLENRTLGMFRKITPQDLAWCRCDIVTDDRDCPVYHKRGKWCPGGSEYEKMHVEDDRDAPQDHKFPGDSEMEDGSEDPITDTDHDEDERVIRDFPGYF